MASLHRPVWRALAVAALALGLGGCTEVEDATVDGYQPSKLTEEGGAKIVSFTQEGADRTGLRTGTVERRGRFLTVPYESVIYDGEGTSYVYASPKPLTYRREKVAIARVSGPQALLKTGPAAGTPVVTVGASEVYGTELEIAGSH